MSGESLTSYVLSTLLDRSARIIREHKSTELTLGDWEKFNDMLRDDTEPNAKLSDALRQYRRRISG